MNNINFEKDRVDSVTQIVLSPGPIIFELRRLLRD